MSSLNLIVNLGLFILFLYNSTNCSMAYRNRNKDSKALESIVFYGVMSMTNLLVLIATK